MNTEEIRLTVAREIALFEAARPKATGGIGIVWVFSGPGTFLSPLKGDDEEIKAWLDQRRLSQGILLVLQVTALRLGKPGQTVTKKDVVENGPMLVYNGIPIENEVFRSVMNLPGFPIPYELILVIDEVEGEEGKSQSIRHTGDQVKSFSPILVDHFMGGATEVALVSSAPHFPRILRYLEMHRSIPEEYQIRSFPIPSEPELAVVYATEEIEALCQYLGKGHLSERPYPADLGLGIATA